MTLRRIQGTILAFMLLALTACAIPPDLAALAETEPYVDPPVATDPQLASFADDVIDQTWSTLSGEVREKSCWEIDNIPRLHEREFRRGFRLTGGEELINSQQLDAIFAAWVARLRRVC